VNAHEKLKGIFYMTTAKPTILYVGRVRNDRKKKSVVEMRILIWRRISNE